jgi:hypothetical protein
LQFFTDSANSIDSAPEPRCATSHNDELHGAALEDPRRIQPTINTFLLAVVIPITPSAFLRDALAHSTALQQLPLSSRLFFELMLCRTAMSKHSTSRLDLPDQQT